MKVPYSCQVGKGVCEGAFRAVKWVKVYVKVPYVL